MSQFNFSFRLVVIPISILLINASLTGNNDINFLRGEENTVTQTEDNNQEYGSDTYEKTESGHIEKTINSTSSETEKQDKADFVIYNSWDFENDDLGEYTETETRNDFNVYNFYDHPGISISYDTINGQETKVLKSLHSAGILYQGFQMNAYYDDEETGYNEVYMSYNIKFGNEWNSTAGGKLSGIRAFPSINVPPADSEGFYAAPMFKQAGRMIAYYYDRTQETLPWATEEYNYDTIFFNNGVWYNITQRMVKNSFSGDTPNADGINEIWVDGRMIFQDDFLRLLALNNKYIDGFFLGNYYGGDTDVFWPLSDEYVYLDNVNIWVNENDPTYGTRSLHDPDEILITPVAITDRTVYYDSLRTTVGVLSNLEYGNTYGSCIDEAYLIDAGENNSVTFTWNHTIGTHDYLFFYDGNTTDAAILRIVAGYSNQSNQTITSSGRYLFIRFSTDRDDENTGWTGTISFSKVPENPSDLELISVDTVNVAFSWSDNSEDEAGFEIQRTEDNINYTVIANVSANATLFNDDNIVTNAEYFYRVRAYNQYGFSDFSDTLNVLVPSSAGVPEDPTDLRIVNVQYNRVELAWNDNSNNENGFQIQRAGNTLEFTTIEFLDPNITSYTDDFSLQPDSTYYYRLRAFNDLGYSGFTSILQVHLPDAPELSPLVLTITKATYNSAELRWNSPETVDLDYTLYRILPGDITTFENISSNQFIDVGLLSNTLYEYKVYANDPYGNRIGSNVCEALTLPRFTQNRVNDNLIALFVFAQRKKDTIIDQSWYQTPANLNISDTSGIEISHSDYIRIHSDNLLISNEAEKIKEACQYSDEITLECWLKTSNTISDFPATLLSLENEQSKAFSLSCAKENSNSDQIQYYINLTTNTTDRNGEPDFIIEEPVEPSILQHIVFTHNSQGEEKIYINNNLVATGFRPPKFDTWEEQYSLVVANSVTDNAPWLGDLYLCAVYNRALGPVEIAQNYYASPFSSDTCILNSEEYQIFVYPNPSNDRITLQIINQNAITEITRPYSLRIYNQQGILLREENVSEIMGNGLLNLDISEMRPGVYTLVLSNSSSLIDQKKIVIIR